MPSKKKHKRKRGKPQKPPTEPGLKKTCTTCSVSYPADLKHFSRHKHGRYGLQSQCRKCRRGESKARMRARREGVSITFRRGAAGDAPRRRSTKKLAKVAGGKAFSDISRAERTKIVKQLKKKCERVGVELDEKRDELIQLLAEKVSIKGFRGMITEEFLLGEALGVMLTTDDAGMRLRANELVAKLQGFLQQSGPAQVVQVVVEGASEQYSVKEVELSDAKPKTKDTKDRG